MTDYTHDANGFAQAFVDAVDNNNRNRAREMSAFYVDCDIPEGGFEPRKTRLGPFATRTKADEVRQHMDKLAERDKHTHVVTETAKETAK